MTAESTYLDVGVSRIQAYLARTPKLKGVRGASAWLSRGTDSVEFVGSLREAGMLPVGVNCNAEAGQADGVVSLTLAGAEPDQVARLVCAELRRRLPAAQLTARCYRGSSYVEAYRRGPMKEWIDLPPVADFPPLATCEQCRIDPQVHEINLGEEGVNKVCPDCAARYHQHYRPPGLRKEWVPVAAERHLLESMAERPEQVAQHFQELAERGDELGNRNHLATVFADGNAIGDLFATVADSGDPAAKREVSRLVSGATRAAWHQAARAVSSEAHLRVIPHVAGGDDLLVTVVADQAWRFVREFLTGFSRRLHDTLPGQFVASHAPSASAGVVFAHHAFPFARATELAGQLLRQAKQAHSGQRAAVAWLDVTREGEQPPPWRRPWPVEDLTTFEPALRELRSVDAAGRSVLARLADPARPALARARLATHARRLEREAVLAPFLAGDDDAAAVARLADALALVRWWR